MTVTLCSPDREKSCFACCPPIRPVHYEHIQYRPILERLLRENRRAFDNSKNEITPITGFSCWALGFIDNRYKQVGCLLHPMLNNGKDLRYRVNYGDKCRRERCPEEAVFSSLKISIRYVWVRLTEGLDSFSYSSKRINPLFMMMGWGKYLLQRIAYKENQNIVSWNTFLQRCPFFATALDPRGHAYLITRLIRRKGIHLLRSEGFRSEFEGFSSDLCRRIQAGVNPHSEEPFVHLLDLDPHFLDFLRLSAKISRLHQEYAAYLKRVVDGEVDQFN